MPRYALGDVVVMRDRPGEPHTISGLGAVHAGEQYYQILVGGRMLMVAEGKLLPYVVSMTPTDALSAEQIGDHDQFQQLLTFHRARRGNGLSNYYFSFNSSRTRFYPHQFKPLIKFLDSPTRRVLIADEVGLGKTIEAGLILTELEARQDLDRVLVVCPSTLTNKWREEMESRFDQKFEIARTSDLRDFLDTYRREPERASTRMIVSLETVRSRGMLADIDTIAPRFDLLVIDEAHHLRNRGRNQHRAGNLLAQNSDAVVFLTATPIQMGQDNLFTLLNLLDPESFISADESNELFQSNRPIVRCQAAISRIPPDAAKAQEYLSETAADFRIIGHPDYPAVQDGMGQLVAAVANDEPTQGIVIDLQKNLDRVNLLGHVFTRTRKRDVQGLKVVRRPWSPEVILTELEQSFYDAVTAFVRAENEEKRKGMRGSGFLLVTPQRRMASSIPAMVAYYRESMRIVGEEPPEDPIGGEYEGYGDEPSAAEARARLEKVVRRWPKDGGPDSKYDVLKDILTKTRDQQGQLQIIVFAFFKDTLNYLQRRLTEDGFGADVVSGDVPAHLRPGIIERFRAKDGIEILLSSRVGSEGLDFQFCHSLVNYDLPWNPMEIEQRIGRLDRLGQDSEVIDIYNLCATNTIEGRILSRLHERVGVFESSVGELEEILGEIIQELEIDIFSGKLTPEEEEERISRAEEAVERRRREIEGLDKEAAAFIGTDLYFDEEVRRISDRHRYVTERQLYSFVRSFLMARCPDSRLEYDHQKHVGRLKPDRKLLSLLHQDPEIRVPRDFVNPPTAGVRMTFNNEVAFGDPRITFINIIHPLVQVMVRQLDEDTHLSVAHHVELPLSSLPDEMVASHGLREGVYVYFGYRLSISSARQRDTLEFVLLNGELELAVPVDAGEVVMGRMLEYGQSAEHPGTIPSNDVRDASQRAEGFFLDHALVVEREHRKSNEIFVNRRLAALNNHYERLIGTKRELLRQALNKRQQENYIRMLQGTIRRLEGEWELRKTDIEKKREVGTQHEEIAAGILELVS